MKKIIKYKSIFVIFTGIVITPFFCSATIIYLSPVQKSVNEGDTFVVDVKVNSKKESINVVDGSVVLDNNSSLEVREISLAGSSFSVWPKEPVLSSDKKTISFVGGVPGGMNSDNAIIFKIILEAKNIGKTTVSPENMLAYINDGKATKSKISTKNAEFDVVKKGNSSVNNEWSNVMLSDKTAPDDFVIEIGQDASMFDGKKFATFIALDKETGIDYYAVSENGDEGEKSGNMYVLKNQNTEPNLKVVAYDKAGNIKESFYPQKTKIKANNFNSIVIIFLIFVLIAVYFVRKNIYKK